MAKRAKPAASSRTLPNGRNKTGRFVKLEHYLLNSPAYRSLCCCARSLLVELYALYNGSNNGTLYMSVRQAQQRLGDVGRKAAEKAFNELQDRGFITVVQKGSFTCKVQLATTWRLTEHDCEGRPATKDFMRWTPPAAAGKKHGAPQGHRRCSSGAPWPPRTGPNAPSRCSSGTPRAREWAGRRCSSGAHS